MKDKISIADCADDAVHIISAVIACLLDAGQHLCLAIEDAVVLTWHLKQQGLTPEALRRYIAQRMLGVAT